MNEQVGLQVGEAHGLADPLVIPGNVGKVDRRITATADFPLIVLKGQRPGCDVATRKLLSDSRARAEAVKYPRTIRGGLPGADQRLFVHPALEPGQLNADQNLAWLGNIDRGVDVLAQQ